MGETLLEDNVFELETSKGKVSLKPYSFAVKMRLLESGFFDKVMEYYQYLTKKKKDDNNFKLMGEALRAIIDAMWIMAPKEVIHKGKDEFEESQIESELYRFSTWLFTQTNKENNFLEQENPKEAKKPE